MVSHSSSVSAVHSALARALLAEENGLTVARVVTAPAPPVTVSGLSARRDSASVRAPRASSRGGLTTLAWGRGSC